MLNAYMTTTNSEKKLTVLGMEFGDNASESAIIDRSLYRLKSTGASF